MLISGDVIGWLTAIFLPYGEIIRWRILPFSCILGGTQPLGHDLISDLDSYATVCYRKKIESIIARNPTYLRKYGCQVTGAQQANWTTWAWLRCQCWSAFLFSNSSLWPPTIGFTSVEVILEKSIPPWMWMTGDWSWEGRLDSPWVGGGLPPPPLHLFMTNTTWVLHSHHITQVVHISLLELLHFSVPPVALFCSKIHQWFQGENAKWNKWIQFSYHPLT